MQNLRRFPSHNPPLSAWGLWTGILHCSPARIEHLRGSTRGRGLTSWGSDVELEEMESEQTGLSFSLPPSPERARANSPVEFLHNFLFPSPKAHDFISFRLDDVLHTAASDSEDFGPALADAFPPSGQEARPSAAYSELVDVLSRATEKLALDWPDEPRESRASKLDERFLIGAHSKLERRKLPFFLPTRRTSWRRWMKGPAWLLKPWRSYEEPLTWLWEPPSTPHVPWGALLRLRWPQNAICGSTWLRFVRRKRCFWWTHPSHNLGYSGRLLAL